MENNKINENIYKVKCNGDGDDDKIIFNISKRQILNHLKETVLYLSDHTVYNWALREGFKPEINEDIRIDEKLILTKRY